MKILKWNGKPIDTPGVYSHVSIDAYHSTTICVGPSVSSSGLRTIFTQSPAHFYSDSAYNKDNDDDDDDEKKAESEAFILGRAAHHILLGEDNFSTGFIMRPLEAPDGRAWNGNNASCREWLEKEAKAGRTVLTPKQIKTIRGMARSLAKDELVSAGILNGGIELSAFWLDEKTGVWCKIRPDSIPNDSGDVADLKTTIKMGDEIDRSIFLEYRYDMQGEMIRWGLREICGLKVESFSLVFVGKKKPFAVDTVTIKEEDLDAAGKDLRAALDTFAYCLKTGNWFGHMGSQSDARFARKSEFAAKKAKWRRSVLLREIGQPVEDEADGH